MKTNLIKDFGLAGLKMNPAEELTEQVGTPIWMAPELLLQQKYSEKVDVYSFAICTYEMITGDVPFASLGFDQMVSQVVCNFLSQLNVRDEEANDL